MPIMTRTNKKTTKIAFDILGTPSNMKAKKKKSKKEKDYPKEGMRDSINTDLMHITHK